MVQVYYTQELIAFLAFVSCALATEVGGLFPDHVQEQNPSSSRRSIAPTAAAEGKTLLGSAVSCFGVALQSSEDTVNEWSGPWTHSNDFSNVPSWRWLHGAATYTRHHERDAGKDDAANMIIFGGQDVTWGSKLLSDTWLYYASVNSWIRPTLTRQPGRRQGHSMTTICKSLVILFGGHDDNHLLAFNDTWMFDGTTETWSELKPVISPHSIAPHTSHSAVAMYQNLSSCTCKESLVVLGGTAFSFQGGSFKSCHRDVWELRCLSDSALEKVYQWFRLQGSSTASGFDFMPRTYPAVFPSRSKTLLYVGGGFKCWGQTQSVHLHDWWRYNFVSGTWTLIGEVNYLNDTGVVAHFPISSEAPLITTEIDGKEAGIAVLGEAIAIVDIRTGNITIPFFARQSSVPTGVSLGASAVTLGDNIVVFGGIHPYESVLYPTVWNLSRSFDYWNWFANPCSLGSPKGRILLQDNVRLAGNSMYIFGGYTFDDSSLISANGFRVAFNDVWELNLITSTWSRVWSSFAPKSLLMTASAVVYDNLVVFFGGSINAEFEDVVNPSGSYAFTPLNTTWGYHTRLRKWTLYETTIRPSRRVCASLADVGNGSLIMFGGLSAGLPLNDMWLLTLCSSDISKVSRTCAQWLQLSSGKRSSGLDSSRYPGPRYYHSAVKVGEYMIVVGGSVAFQNCLQEMWLYSLSKGDWTSKNALELPKPPMFRCQYLMTLIGTKIVILHQNWTVDSAVARQDNVDAAVGTVVYSYDMKSSSGWTIQAGGPEFAAVALVSWRRQIFALGPLDPHTNKNVKDRNQMILSSMTPGCIAGQSSPLWPIDSCDICPVGTYALKGSTECTSCPRGLTTSTSAATSLLDCVCQKNYCQGHGTCYVVPYSSGIAPLCNCDMGYSGANCQYPFLYIIFGATMAFIVILLFICLLVFKCLQYRKRKTVVENELGRMKKVWSIGWEEIHIESHVAGGGFGDVSKARYREMTVAVKMLHQDLISFIEEEKAFAREVELMQTIRHPNIVLFLGAGKSPDGCPFIVLEYVTNGTVRNILDRDDIPISHARRIQFCLNAASGMMFLHGLIPPRMHRDLKSLNLLMTQDWTVKVADFGTSTVVEVAKSGGKLLRRLRVGSKRKQGGKNINNERDLDDYSLQSVNAPLLSENIGTRQWQAPETIGHQTHYWLPADVYSFGMVMWEILTRKLPYHDRPDLFAHKLKADIVSGVRPQVPPNSSTAYVELMSQCWQTEPQRRPSFEVIVHRLTSMQKEHLQTDD